MSKITVKTSEKRFPIAPDLYGIFFEDISHAGDGGIYPEMLRNRSFEDSLLPEGCVTNDGGKTFVSPTGWIDEFNGGEGMNNWVEKNQIVPTPVPAWYTENAEMTLDAENTLNAKRKVSLKVDFQPGGRIRNIGYAGVPQHAGKAYHFYVFLKTEKPVTLDITIEEDGVVLSSAEIEAKGNGWVRYDCSLVGTKTTGNAAFYITCREGGTVRFGFSSLMPADTFNGHGLRRDLVEKLRDMNPAFLRFPGGCIVEGFTKETAMYFRNVVGPVWERPSHWLLWHYRATNGLGFHEYLQLCEDLNLSPLYVCNCGMTCQGRGPYYYNDEEQEDMIQDTLNAIEYAVGPADSEWGSLRAKMGHEAPFGLEYLEIGNENSGPEYERRYNLVRDAVLARYPNLKIIANDRGRDEKLKTDIADDHYYNMPEFFAENYDMYKDYDRNEPDIFVGEFAVNQTYEGQLRAAISEAMYMVGMERNQDVVKLASYAPLFEHVNFSSWYPNLLIYDNYRSYTIPTYYAWRLFGGSRGKDVVESSEEFRKIYLKLAGLPAITGDYGMRYRGAKWNGEAVAATHEVFGKLVAEGEDLVLTEVPPKRVRPFKLPSLVAMGEDVEAKAGTFEVEVLADGGREVGVGILCAPKPLSFYDRNNPNPVDPWEMRFLEMFRWVIRDGKSCVLRGMRGTAISEEKEVKLLDGQYNKLSYIVKQPYVELYLNGELIDTVELPHYQSMCSVVTDTEDEIIIKAVNFDDVADDIEITLDCDVASEYTVGLLTGNAEDENTIENPDNVHDVLLNKTGAARTFTYTAPALSVNILTLKKA
ncbi:MAG: alpha-L-arabinofuranosidase [Ruminococcaceae bacterium]|nr:alpha-L-arabinofuranosidase [Oscillospiraceae bacterium]